MVLLYVAVHLVLLTALSACRKDEEGFRVYPASAADLSAIWSQVPDPGRESSFSFSGFVPDTVLTTTDGTRIFLTDTENLFANGNTPAPCSQCQELTIKVTEAIRRGDMISRGLYTKTTDGMLLESGGMVQLSVVCDGVGLNVLNGRNIKIQIPEPNQLGDLFVYEGDAPTDSLLGWINTGEPVYLADWQVPPAVTVKGYELIAVKTGWVQAAKPAPGPFSSFCVDLPDGGFSSANTKVFLSFKGIKSVVALTPNSTGDKFCIDNVPKGLPVKMITVSKLGDQYWLGNKDTEIGTDATVVVAPQPVTEQQIVNFLKLL